METAEVLHTLEVPDNDFDDIIAALRVTITLYKNKALEETKAKHTNPQLVMSYMSRVRHFKRIKDDLVRQTEVREIH